MISLHKPYLEKGDDLGDKYAKHLQQWTDKPPILQESLNVVENYTGDYQFWVIGGLSVYLC